MREQQVSIAGVTSVRLADGSVRVIDSMFSQVCDLANDHAEVLCRLHPEKKRRFDSVLAEAAQAGAASQRVDIELHVNHLHGGIAVLNYAELVRTRHHNIAGEASARGFEPGAEPVIRQLRDKSFRLVFHAMPPAHHRLGEAFDPEHFGSALVASCSADMHQDDRDVFYIASSAGAEHIKEIFTFLRDYQGAPPAP
ncbi:MAG: hypothetical protein H7176_13595 [Bdellovibrionales bacterium]|nr:hypothetical protein [Massilia sp.]